MSLQVWLPLNGNLQNKGLDQITTITINTNIFQEGGKIGSKAIDVSGIYKFTVPSLVKTNIFSVSFWYKPITDSNITTNWNKILVFNTLQSDFTTSGSLFRFQSSYGSAIRYAISIHNNPSQSIADVGHPLTNIWDTWHHIVAISNGEYCKTYCDGQLIRSDKCNGGVLTGEVFLGYSGTRPHGLMNDLRIYNHCLSLKEIKEISKGLILHYPLDNNGLGKINPNMISNSSFSKDLTGWRGYPTYHTIEIKDGYSCAHLHSDTFAQTRYLAPNAKDNLAPYNGYQLTFSADVLLQNVVKGTTNYYLALYQSGATIDGRWRTPTILENSGHFITAKGAALDPDKLNGKGWTRVWIKIRFGDYNWPTSYFLDVHERDFTGDFYIKNVKIEEGLESTPWIPNSEDEQYDTLGYNQNTIYDTSGYQNNGILTDLTYSTDTLKYNASANFDGNTSVISLGNISSLLQKQFTINLWFKKLELGSKNYETLFGGPSGFEMDTRAGGSTTLSLYMASTRGGNVFSSFNLNQWYMVTMVNDGTNELYYINGELKKTIAKKSMPSGNYFIGAWSTAIKQNYKGLISDFRIYSTVLNEKDILELYHTSVIVDKNNNFYTYQYNEQEYSNELQYFYDWIKINGSGTFSYEEDGLHLNEYIRVQHDFISINPENKTFKYDIVYSVDAGNQFYIGWERYDEDKTLRSNNATVYVITIKPNTDLKYQHAQGVVNLSTDGVNPCAFIRLRILNKWAGSTEDTNGTAIIHSLSLKEYDSNKTITPIKIERQGITTTNSFIENSIGTSIDRSQVLHSNSFYEI